MPNQNCIHCGSKSDAEKHLTQGELTTLGTNCARVNFKKGELIFQEGNLATNIVYLTSGLVKIHMKGPVSDKILRLTKAPAYLGLPTTIGDKVNQYSATALSNSTACFISLDIFRDFIVQNSGFAYEIILDLCRNELTDYQRYTNLSQKQLPGRLAEILMCLSEKIFESNRFELPLSITELADFISSSRESVSRQLSEFAKSKIIKLSGRELEIVNTELLQMICMKG